MSGKPGQRQEAKGQKAAEAAVREARLAEALRQNLARRKQQIRARKGAEQPAKTED